MKKTIINYAIAGAFIGSLLMNVVFAYIINDSNKIAIDYIDKTIELREQVDELENINADLEKEVTELNEQVKELKRK